MLSEQEQKAILQNIKRGIEQAEYQRVLIEELNALPTIAEKIALLDQKISAIPTVEP